MQNDIKIVVAGPPKSGKTEISDILSAASKGFQGNYKPTVCVRILEFTTTIEVSGLQTNISVQLWDTSGDDKYSPAWPAIAKDSDGCIFVYNAHDKGQSRAVENYIKAFSKDLDPSLCMVAANRIGQIEGKPPRPKLPKGFEEATITMLNAQEDMDPFVEQFSVFLGKVYQAKMKAIEERERKLIGEPVVQKKKEVKRKKTPKPQESEDIELGNEPWPEKDDRRQMEDAEIHVANPSADENKEN
ncbi:intraflagellar transport protein [Histomonas meleagridis]|uniref:intraflagellar transport protein 22-like isoform X1 n=1 Tax=Histomonas meleagridis TaxID=135588 RepID=UPI00355A05A7|nr:intraflagellar transport protein [Histomonas meleagridis]KAH0798537.1 intraflagellar transport protein 22-like isoform X1 [Histomonas meleagridis]